MPAPLRISEAASLALHAMVLLSGQAGRTMSAPEIARRLRVSGHHLSKVLQRLGRAGLVDSRRGPKGGFSLAKAGAEITLLDIYQAVEGPAEDQGCLLGRPACQGGCALGGLRHLLGAEVVGQLARTSLGDLAQGLGKA